MRIKCYDIAESMFSEVSAINEEKRKEFEETCELVDKFIEVYEASACTVELKPEDNLIMIEVECCSFEIDCRKENPFTSLLSRTEFVEFKSPAEDQIVVTLYVDGIFE